MASPLNNFELMQKAIEFPTIRAALEYLGLRSAGGNYIAFKAACKKHNLSIPSGPYPRTARLAQSDEELFVNGKTAHGQRLKTRLIELGLEDKCVLCGQLPFWNELPLVLQMDHINGIHNDNRIENLRILCPNCHTQTETFTGKHTRKKSKPEKIKPFSNYKVYTVARKTKVNWPILSELIEEVNLTSKTAVGKRLGVSETAVRKHIKVELVREQLVVD